MMNKADNIEKTTYNALINRLYVYTEKGVFGFLDKQTNINFSNDFSYLNRYYIVYIKKEIVINIKKVIILCYLKLMFIVMVLLEEIQEDLLLALLFMIPI